MKPTKTLAFAFLLAALWSAATLPARADNFTDGSLEKGLANVAKDLIGWMEEEKVDTVSISDFTGSPQFGYSGPFIQKTLIDELEKKKKNVVNQKSSNFISGRWVWPNAEKAGTLISIDIVATITKSDGRSLDCRCQVRSTRDVTKFVGSNGHIDPDGTQPKRHEQLRKQHIERVQNPTVEIRENTIVALKGQPYALQILTRPANTNYDYTPKKAILDEAGHPFVDIKQGEEYVVKIINNDKCEIAAAVAIDGLDIFTFSADKNLKYHIFESGKPGQVNGWHKSVKDSRYTAFLVTEYGKGENSKYPTVGRGKAGIIHVAFSFSKIEGARSGSETAQGQDLHIKQAVVTRQIEVPHAFITVRYAR